MVCGIYKLTNQLGHHYIGQSVDVNWRLESYKRYDCEGQWKLHMSLKRHGWENHTKEIVRVCKESQLNFWEKYYQYMYQSWGTPWGLNCKECGGAHGRWCDETRKRIGIGNKGKTKGRKIPMEIVLKTKETKKRNAKPSLLKGVKKSKEHILNNIKARKVYFERNELLFPPKIKVYKIHGQHLKNIKEGQRIRWEKYYQNKLKFTS